MAPHVGFAVGLHGCHSSGTDGATLPSHEVERDFRYAGWRSGSGLMF